ncbi:MAG: hypothetical protein GY937_26865 [bacterium]|nr:hypothetical protein [bacterium]
MLEVDPAVRGSRLDIARNPDGPDATITAARIQVAVDLFDFCVAILHAKLDRAFDAAYLHVAVLGAQADGADEVFDPDRGTLRADIDGRLLGYPDANSYVRPSEQPGTRTGNADFDPHSARPFFESRLDIPAAPAVG